MRKQSFVASYFSSLQEKQYNFFCGIAAANVESKLPTARKESKKGLGICLQKWNITYIAFEWN